MKMDIVFENNPDDPNEYSTHIHHNANYGKWKVYTKDIDHDDDEELKDRIKRTGNKFKDRKN